MADLFDKDTAVVAEIVQTVEEHREEVPTGQLIAFREQGFNLTIPQMMGAMDDYFEKRNAFRQRILRELVEGVHFGYPPGCKSSTADEKQWKASPSLYKRGAAEICSLFKLRPEFSADLNLWQQLGSKPGTIAIKCRLYNLAGDVVGEGYGSRKVGDKGMQENASVKMAEKSALVDAVLNGFGLSDLFTQDLEDLDREPYQTPDARKEAPPVKTRARRPSEDRFKEMKKTFAAHYPSLTPEQLIAKLKQSVEGMTGERMEKPHEILEWTPELVTKAMDYMQMNWNS